jgi:hypothetical protein
MAYRHNRRQRKVSVQSESQSLFEKRALGNGIATILGWTGYRLNARPAQYPNPTATRQRATEAMAFIPA